MVREKDDTCQIPWKRCRGSISCHRGESAALRTGLPSAPGSRSPHSLRKGNCCKVVPYSWPDIVHLQRWNSSSNIFPRIFSGNVWPITVGVAFCGKIRGKIFGAWIPPQDVLYVDRKRRWRWYFWGLVFLTSIYPTLKSWVTFYEDHSFFEEKIRQ